MPKVNAQADVAHDWRGLIDALDKNPDLLQLVQDERKILGSSLDEFQVVKGEQEEADGEAAGGDAAARRGREAGQGCGDPDPLGAEGEGGTSERAPGPLQGGAHPQARAEQSARAEAEGRESRSNRTCCFGPPRPTEPVT